LRQGTKECAGPVLLNHWLQNQYVHDIASSIVAALVNHGGFICSLLVVSGVSKTHQGALQSCLIAESKRRCHRSPAIGQVQQEPHYWQAAAAPPILLTNQWSPCIDQPAWTRLFQAGFALLSRWDIWLCHMEISKAPVFSPTQAHTKKCCGDSKAPPSNPKPAPAARLGFKAEQHTISGGKMPHSRPHLAQETTVDPVPVRYCCAGMVRLSAAWLLSVSN
jgi:hypothetical protein